MDQCSSALALDTSQTGHYPQTFPGNIEFPKKNQEADQPETCSVIHFTYSTSILMRLSKIPQTLHALTAWKPFSRQIASLMKDRRVYHYFFSLQVFYSNFENLFSGLEIPCNGMIREHWRRPGSNRQPLACKASALPIELRPRNIPESEALGKGCLSVRRHLRQMGQTGIEPVTLPLSGARSSQLSY